MSESPPDFPYPLTAVPGSEALEQWRALRSSWRKDGGSPILLGDAEEVAQIGENFKFNDGSVESLLAAANSLTVERFFKERVAQEEDYYSGVDEGSWPTSGVAGHRLCAHVDILSRQPKETVYIAKIPTRNSFEIPAYLKCGGWNECPGAAEHVAIMRYWSEKYGIELFAITDDIIECIVLKPPTDREAAIALAREQFIYCSDIVYQGVGTLLSLAATLKDARCWYFWWD